MPMTSISVGLVIYDDTIIMHNNSVRARKFLENLCSILYIIVHKRVCVSSGGLLSISVSETAFLDISEIVVFKKYHNEN